MARRRRRSAPIHCGETWLEARRPGRSAHPDTAALACHGDLVGHFIAPP
ncbi:Uncharacterized protein ToN1_43810 [Aromatoleum petrolei]|nr:Uncharacterized protein ToN1_43810 [Aromatoleum petrolei]